MARLTITIDEKLIKDAQRLGGSRTKREAIELALREFVQQRSMAKLADLVGSGIVDMDVDELRKWRNSGMPGE